MEWVNAKERQPDGSEDVLLVRGGPARTAQVGYFLNVWYVYQVDADGMVGGAYHAVRVFDVVYWAPINNTLPDGNYLF